MKWKQPSTAGANTGPAKKTAKKTRKDHTLGSPPPPRGAGKQLHIRTATTTGKPSPADTAARGPQQSSPGRKQTYGSSSSSSSSQVRHNAPTSPTCAQPGHAAQLAGQRRPVRLAAESSSAKPGPTHASTSEG